MRKYIIIDVYECNGCGTCVEICPEVFGMDESDEKAILLDPDAEVTGKVEEAAAYCPQKCIAIA
ncbi:MAG: ferredoxin [Proteobacteria bacterium]|nr:ferredoxin [Pseudomonadota bacterium]MBU1140076.1 ferredoxin [Pseudomonadota bacterium]MBU1234910.1 ferredoxin [Pseudomonadota bacterium]MBU1420737.1 ferredoxin [Pseudomonadota bacterium]MBU1456540.1 ferredoxin [Pseudomonadota bacterium]